MLGAAAIALLAACAVSSVSPERPDAAVPDRSAEVAVGRATRAEVRAALGATLLASERWRFDLFRAVTSQAEVKSALTPLPIPFARITDELHRYTLVRYDDEGRVAASATGLFRKPADWRNVSPIRWDHPALHLRADDVLFFVDPEGARDANLLATPAARDRFLAAARASSGCTVVLGCVGTGCPDRLTLDGAPPRRLPLRNAHAYWMTPGSKDLWLEGLEPQSAALKEPWLETLVALELAAGAHALRFSAQHLDGAGDTSVDCGVGEVAYLEVSTTAVASFWAPTLGAWRFSTSATMPERFARRPLVLVDDGAWVVAAD